MILLTGATGYLGSQIARVMIERNMNFRVYVREPRRLDFNPGAAPCEIAIGDLDGPHSLGEAMRGVTHVIHTAALVKMWVRDRKEFQRVNVGGLQNVLRAAEAAGVKRVVYTSSFIALGPSADTNAGEGLRNAGKYSNEYEATKARALEWLRQEGFRKFPVVALFPGVIYGPGPQTEGNLVGSMIEQYRAGKFPGLLGDGNQRWSFAYNADVVDAHLAALERGRSGEEYVLGGDNRSLNDFFRLLAEQTNVRRPVRHLPFLLGKLVGALEVAKANLTGRLPQLTPGVVEIFKHDWVYSSAKATRELGYRVTPLEEGLRRTLSH
ncbi:MAG: NAD-dependent epimerase/dehydratase family protein [Terriglobia bacterium]|jgi:farnesol dehydrogenase